jgi:hypothetical protein
VADVVRLSIPLRRPERHRFYRRGRFADDGSDWRSRALRLRDLAAGVLAIYRAETALGGDF